MRQRKVLAVALTVCLLSSVGVTTSCGPDDLGKLHDTLNKTAKSLEAAIDTNGRLYSGGIYGAVGSPGAIEMRQRVARVIRDSAVYVKDALVFAKTLTKETFEGGKIAVLEKLTLAASGLSVGHQTIDLVLQGVATLINQAVVIVQLFQSNVIRSIPRALPAIEKHIKEFNRLQEVAV
jgi:hypothetical protein